MRPPGAAPALRRSVGRAGTLVLMAVLPCSASGQNVAGTWNATWAQAVRIEHDGSVTIQRWGEAVLELRQRGDSVVGTWTIAVGEPVRWTVAGTVHDGRLDLVATKNDRTNPELAAVRAIRWRGTLEGGHMDGEMKLELEGARRERPWRPWRADRAG